MRPLKILQVINYLPSGGAEKLVVEISKKIAERGNEVHIFLFSDKKTDLFNEVTESELLKVFSPEIKTSSYHIGNIFKLKKHLNKYSYDIINVHLFPSLYWAALALALGKNSTPLIYTEQNTHNRRRNHWLMKRLDQYIYRRYNKIIACSDIANKNLKEHITSTDLSVVTINNGVNLKAIRSASAYDKSEFGLAKTAKLVMQVSSFRDQKDQKTLIRAVSIMDDDVHLLLVGGGPLVPECKKLAADLQITERVHFLGVRNDVPKLLKTTDITVLSSHHEGLSLASVECMGSGKPFVASDVQGLREVVKGAGVLVKESDHEELAKAMNLLLTDAIYCQKVVADCLDRAKKYDIEIAVDKYLEVYEEQYK